MLRSILVQLVPPPLPDMVKKLWHDCRARCSKPSHRELLDTIGAILATYEHVFLILDALDEYPEDKPPGRAVLLEVITQLVKTHPQIHVVITSRREPDIREALENIASSIIVADQAFNGDVERFVDHAFKHKLRKWWDPELVALAIRTLLS